MISRSNLNQQEQNWNSKIFEKKVLIIKTAASFMHQGWNVVSIIHMWVHVIYLQLEWLSIQQLKPKNCWYTADETFASLSAPAFLKWWSHDMDHCSIHQFRLLWTASAPPAFTLATSLHYLSETLEVLWRPVSLVLPSSVPNSHRKRYMTF